MALDLHNALNEIATSDDQPSADSLSALSALDEGSVNSFIKIFSRLDEGQRRRAMRHLVKQAERDFMLDYDAIFFRCVDADDPEVRRYAIDGLWEYERKDLIVPLLERLRSDSFAYVRASAAMALGRYVFMAECDELSARQAGEIRDALVSVVEDDYEEVRVVRRAVESLAYINDDKEIRSIIERAYAHDDPEMRASALFAMGRHAERRWADIVITELHSEEPGLRYEAARASGELGLREAISRLIELAEGSDGEVQAVSIRALGQIGGQRARRALEEYERSDSAAVREAAADALEELDFAEGDFDLLVYDPHGSEFHQVDVSEEGDEEEDDADEKASYREEFWRYGTDAEDVLDLG